MINIGLLRLSSQQWHEVDHGGSQTALPNSTLESRIIGGVGIIGGLDIVIIINNRGGGWTGLKK